MPPVILLGLIMGLPLILFAVLRVKPLYLFTTIITGYLWVQYLGEPAELMLDSLVNMRYPDVVARLILLLLPLALTLFFMKGSLPASSLPFQFFLLVANSLLLGTIVINNLTPGLQASLQSTNAGSIAHQSSDVLIAGIAGLHVLVMWIMRPRHDSGHGHRKKKH